MAKVIIIGCGVAGPTLAIFLKRLGFQPVIYERAKQFADAGLSLLFVCSSARRVPTRVLVSLTTLGHARGKVYSPMV
jgi:2-polyprenyl-6-methoxyphenol hydroxylase-like FAD-dependent oxidoreductase